MNDISSERPASQATCHSAEPEPQEGFGPTGESQAQKEWCKRFVTRMIDSTPFDRFDDGELILDYAEYTAPTYYETDWQREMGPEECADADMSYWGEE